MLLAPPEEEPAAKQKMLLNAVRIGLADAEDVRLAALGSTSEPDQLIDVVV